MSHQSRLIGLVIAVSSGLMPVNLEVSLALPPPEEIPEEVLRTEIITEARSPLDGKLLTAAEYAQLRAQLAESPFPPELNPQIRQIILLLEVRRFIKTILPFL